jgi:hypothetical protein
MRYGRMHCVRFGEELPFMECDDAREYARVRESFYPSLLAIEDGASKQASAAS